MAKTEDSGVMPLIYTLSFPSDEDICDLAAHLRQSDIDELVAIGDDTPEEVIIKSMQASDPALTRAAHVDGRLACIFGCSPRAEHIAAPWLLCTDVVSNYNKTLTRDTKQVVRGMLEKYPVLTNVVDVRNTRTIQWLEVLGFKMMEIVEYKPGFPLFRFEMRAA
ncbi:hypothetical protein QZJ86_12055 [Methylomonas montana]|uniref:hypothetical protein n=1 Tax=Methylomonas montana TaxID=3058963 RepID=UPI0026596CC7|nr:hypothetical protein [Methylomonas montana]WKJ88755.1 hypothetical protein QZJ86_12055 [Methylomonas montana]